MLQPGGDSCKDRICSEYVHGFATFGRDPGSRMNGGQLHYHLRHDSLRSTQKAIPDIQPERVRSLQLTGHGYYVHTEAS